MATLRDIRRRINSVKNTQTITRAMQMVAAAKLRRAQESIEKARPYAEKISDVVSSLVGRIEDPSFHPLLAKREERRVDIVVITADRGLCGAFNINVMEKAEKFARDKNLSCDDVKLTCIGTKAVTYFRRRGFNIRAAYRDRMSKFQFKDAVVIAEDLIKEFERAEVDRIYIFFNYFKSVGVQLPVTEVFLPVESPEKVESVVDYIYEPSAGIILNSILPRYTIFKLYRSMLESAAAEQAARMNAMEKATSNCRDMLERLTLLYHKERQASITKEMIDIVSGAEAVK